MNPLMYFLVGGVFLILIIGAIYTFIQKDKGHMMEVRQDKTVWVSHDLGLTKRYISGFIESEKRVNGNIVMLLKPTYAPLNEKLSDVKPFLVCVTPSMIKRTNEAKNPVVFIEPYMDNEFSEVVKTSTFYNDIFSNRNRLSIKEKEVNDMRDILINHTSSVTKSLTEPFTQALQERLFTKNKIDQFRGQANTTPQAIPMRSGV